MSVAWKSKFGTNRAGNSTALMLAEFEKPPRATLVVAKAHEVVTPRNELARTVHAGLEEMKTSGPVMIVAHVVFARPQHLDRNADLLGDGRRLAHVVVGQPPTEASTRVLDVNRDVLLRNVQGCRDELPAPLRRLRRRPDFHHAVAVVRRAVLRLERRVRNKGGTSTLPRRPWPHPAAPGRRRRPHAAGSPASGSRVLVPAAQSLRCSAGRWVPRSRSPAGCDARSAPATSRRRRSPRPASAHGYRSSPAPRRRDGRRAVS